MIKVRLEILSWLTEALDIKGTSGTVTIEQEIEEGKTVRDILNRLAIRYPYFGQVVNLSLPCK